MNAAPALISFTEVCKRTTLSRTDINLKRTRKEFPEPVRLGVKRIAFVEAEVNAWINRVVENRAGR